MLLPEPHWRKSSEVDTSRMRFLQPQRLVLWVCSKASAFWFVAAAYERRCVSESGCITAWCVIVLFFGLQDDLNLSGYRKYLTSQAAPLPLTAAEEELRQIKLSEVQTHTHRYIIQMSFPLWDHFGNDTPHTARAHRHRCLFRYLCG